MEIKSLTKRKRGGRFPEWYRFDNVSGNKWPGTGKTGKVTWATKEIPSSICGLSALRAVPKRESNFACVESSREGGVGAGERDLLGGRSNDNRALPIHA